MCPVTVAFWHDLARTEPLLCKRCGSPTPPQLSAFLSRSAGMMSRMAGAEVTPGEEVERTADPSSLTRFHFHHPWIAGLVAGLGMLGVVLANGLPWFLGIAVGLALFLWTGLVWRPGGPGQRMRRYMLTRFPRHETGDRH